MRFEDYAIIVSPLSKEDGGGYLASFPDLPGCVSDGETPEEAIEEARDAFAAWAASVLQDHGELPQPKTYSGQYVQRIPKTLHMRLAQRAQVEGVSLNQLSATILAEGLARV
jgi:antitoxin HicB